MDDIFALPGAATPAGAGSQGGQQPEFPGVIDAFALGGGAGDAPQHVVPPGKRHKKERLTGKVQRQRAEAKKHVLAAGMGPDGEYNLALGVETYRGVMGELDPASVFAKP